MKCGADTDAGPVVLEFGLVKFGPSEDQPLVAGGEVAVEDLERVDPDLRLAFVVLGVKVRRS